MSVDKLQEKIRKQKNPSVVNFALTPEQIPPQILAEETDVFSAYGKFCRELLTALKGLMPGVRFSYGSFALAGPEGLALLKALLAFAKEQEYYVFLDAPEALSAQTAENGARWLMGADAQWQFDALVIPMYIGSDSLRPYLQAMAENDKAVFAVLRTSNRTAPELQDLLSGSRLVHTAMADIVSRLGEAFPGRSGYSRLAALAAASAPDSLRTLRTKYRGIFLLLDGYDYPNANAKNCSYAFDRFGHGAAACAGSSITAAWVAAETDGGDYLQQAVCAAERMKKNLGRYVTIL